MRYDRKIKYFDYNVDGERVQGAGFVKMELRDGKCRLQFQISGLHVTDNFTKEIYVVGKRLETELCKISIKGGRGNMQLELQPDNLCGGVSYEEVDAFRVPIAAGRELYCGVSGAVILAGEREKREDVNKGIDEGTGKDIGKKIYEEVNEGIDGEISKEIDQRINKTLDEEISDEINETISVGKDERIEETISEIASEERTVEEKVGEKPEPDIISPNLKMSESKWKQLSIIYPHIQPFEDERDYLKVGPEDFVVLSGKSYQLVHNSFLLHGYYNYQHLILTRQEGRGEIRYYIGVPGNFYEREKQVAVMFGFESFECKNEPANMGDYGYYMIRVDL